MIEPYTLDANILFYAVDIDAGYKHMLAAELLRYTPHANCLVTLQSLGEVYNAISRRKPQYREAAEELIVSLGESVNIYLQLFRIFLRLLLGKSNVPCNFGTRCCGLPLGDMAAPAF